MTKRFRYIAGTSNLRQAFLILLLLLVMLIQCDLFAEDSINDATIKDFMRKPLAHEVKNNANEFGPFYISGASAKIDLQEQIPGTLVEFAFLLTNDTLKDLTIQSVISGCPCAKGEPEEKLLKYGDSISIPFKYQVSHGVGEFGTAMSVIAQTLAGETVTVVINIRGISKSPVSLSLDGVKVEGQLNLASKEKYTLQVIDEQSKVPWAKTIISYLNFDEESVDIGIIERAKLTEKTCIDLASPKQVEGIYPGRILLRYLSVSGKEISRERIFIRNFSEEKIFEPSFFIMRQEPNGVGITLELKRDDLGQIEDVKSLAHSFISAKILTSKTIQVLIKNEEAISRPSLGYLFITYRRAESNTRDGGVNRKQVSIPYLILPPTRP